MQKFGHCDKFNLAHDFIFDSDYEPGGSKLRLRKVDTEHRYKVVDATFHSSLTRPAIDFFALQR